MRSDDIKQKLQFSSISYDCSLIGDYANCIRHQSAFLPTLGFMNYCTCEYDVTPEAALAALSGYEGPLLIDFDETLYLRNSTEDFIDCAGPAWLVAMVLRILDVLKPWRLTGRDTQDAWRANVVWIAFPWSRSRWRARVPLLAQKYANAYLAAALEARPDVPIILTVGFRPIVLPLLAAMGYPNAELIASRMFSFADRRNGKLHMAVRKLGHDTVRKSLVLTDSIADLELLRVCKKPLRTRWPDAKYIRAFGDAYVPGEYISRVKHPGERYIFRAILQEEFALWVLSSIGLAPDPLMHLMGLLLLLLSFWAIYERGYVDNDLVASRYESDPKLTAAFNTQGFSKSLIQPWIWATLSGAAGVALIHPAKESFSLHFAAWMGVLATVYLCFIFYNRLDKQTRTWLYPFLQLGRTASFTVVASIEPAGIAALSAHMFSRWLPYLIYRMTASRDWPESRVVLVRLISFILFSLTVVASLGPAALLTWGALGLLLWNVFRARQDLYDVFTSARRIGRSEEKKEESIVSGSSIPNVNKPKDAQ
jgi:hypothetical protein